jgi:hypothetical protein
MRGNVARRRHAAGRLRKQKNKRFACRSQGESQMVRRRINTEMGVIFDEIEIEEVIAPLL